MEELTIQVLKGKLYINGKEIRTVEQMDGTVVHYSNLVNEKTKVVALPTLTTNKYKN